MGRLFVIFPALLVLQLLQIQEIRTAVVIHDSSVTSSATSLSCGGILDEEHGKIAYKPEELNQRNERCVWVLRSFNHDMVNVRVVNPPSAGSVVDIATFTRSSVNSYTYPLVTNRRLLQGNATLHGSVALITLATQNDTLPNQAISISYKFLGFAPRNISRQSTTYLNSGVMFPRVLDHPSGGGNYSNQELSIHVVQPPANRAVAPRYLARLDILGLQNSYDSVYRYTYSIANGWSLASTMATIGQYIVRVTEPQAYVFISDNTVVSSGFKLGFFNPEH